MGGFRGGGGQRLMGEAGKETPRDWSSQAQRSVVLLAPGGEANGREGLQRARRGRRCARWSPVYGETQELFLFPHGVAAMQAPWPGPHPLPGPPLQPDSGPPSSFTGHSTLPLHPV